MRRDILKKKLILSTAAILPLLGGVAVADGFGIVNYEFVNIRVGPSMKDAVKFVLKKGDKVEILSEKDGWLNIKINGKMGWINSQAISRENKTNNIKSVSKNKTKYVAIKRLNLRTSPSTKSKVIRVLQKGEKVLVIEEGVEWSKVKYSGKLGYVATKYLTDASGETASSSSKEEGKDKSVIKVVKSNILNMREKRDALSRKVVTLKKGDRVKFIEEINGWDKISFQGKLGYVSSYYLENIDKNDPSFDELKDDINQALAEHEAANKPNNDKEVSSTTSYKDMGMSLEKFVDLELENSLNVNSSSGWREAEKNELMEYMNPKNFEDEDGMMQFALLDRYTDDISPAQLNNYLKTVCKPGNVFYNRGAEFINAAKKNNINVLYLVSHSMIETGNGTSKLANGIKYKGKTVYNFFGIGAVDGNAVSGGAATAYKNGWTSVAAGIDGAAKWISGKYIHNEKFKQNTLYTMKWSKEYIWHQYASDIAWPSKIGAKMNKVASFSGKKNTVSYLIPKYR